MSQYYPGQQIVASDGARYTLTHWAELTWWAVRTGSACALPLPVRVLYPAWGGDDDRAGADCAARAQRSFNRHYSRRIRRGA